MIITNIQQGKRDKERVNLFIDGTFVMAIDKKTLVKSNLYKGKEVSQELLNQIAVTDSVHYLSRKLLSWCFKRPRSVMEMRQKLKEKIAKRELIMFGDDFEVDYDSIISKVIDKLSSQGCNDQEYSRWFTEERIRQAKYGPHKIVSDLISSGVDSRLAKDTVAELYTDIQPVKSQVLSKKFGVENIDQIEDFADKTKAIRFLKSRGF